MTRALAWASRAGLALLTVACGQASPQADGIADPVASPSLVADQFGYLPQAEKIVIVRQPVEGFDSGDGAPPAAAYLLREASSGAIIRRLVPDARSGGEVDALSGDRVWTLDLSDVTEAGEYRLEAEGRPGPALALTIGADVYRPVLREAFRTFYYQRAGVEKAAPFADPRWSDGASHVGAGQDHEARDFFRPDEAATARDLSGGWYDAGDFNQYTNWTAEYCRLLLMSFTENPDAWGDDFGIPESGNGVSDLLDEVRWGLDWLVRMQNADGSVLSILGRDTASPPSQARGASRYGPASTSATLSTAAAFALAATVFGQSSVPEHRAYADDLRERAVQAWGWAEANPGITFYNNDARDSSLGLGAGQQEVDEAFRNNKRITAALYLLALTGEATFATAAKAGLAESALVREGLVDAYRTDIQDAAFFAIRTGRLDEAMARRISNSLRARTNITSGGYRVPVDAVHWGSNAVIARTGLLYLDAARLSPDAADRNRLVSRAADYLSYLHGRNPLGKAYLSNMGAFGAENSVDQFYHGWFADGTRWSSTRLTGIGPAPGFLVGGPNPGYDWDGCCPARCGGMASCGAAPPRPPYGQPPLKAYRDFNAGWPLNSWQVTENSGGYQAAYLRLLANFIPSEKD